MSIINFDTMPSVYWDDNVKISYLQRRIIVCSLMYCKQNESCVSDAEYDAISHQLVQLQSSIEEAEWKRSRYYHRNRTLRSSTGFDIPSRLNKNDMKCLSEIAILVYDRWKRNTQATKEVLRC